MGGFIYINMKNDFVKLIDRLSRLEESNKNQTKQLNDIHRTLLGNGHPGIIAEWNQWKGGVKFFGWIIGVMVAGLSVAVSLLVVAK